MSWKITSGISWTMTESPDNAYAFDKNYEPDLEKTKVIMNKKVPIKRGDEITVLYVDHEPYLVTKWNKKDGTLKEVLEHLYEALDTPLEPNWEETKGIYMRISNWFKSEARLELVKKYENGTLKPKELLGEHRYFEGMGREGSSKNIWVSTGS